MNKRRKIFTSVMAILLVVLLLLPLVLGAVEVLP